MVDVEYRFTSLLNNGMLPSDGVFAILRHGQARCTTPSALT